MPVLTLIMVIKMVMNLFAKDLREVARELKVFIALSVIFSGIKREVWQIRRFSIYRGR